MDTERVFSTPEESGAACKYVWFQESVCMASDGIASKGRRPRTEPGICEVFVWMLYESREK